MMVCLALAGSPALVQAAPDATPAVSKPAAKKPAAQVARKTTRKPVAKKPTAPKPAAATVKAYEAVPAAERLAIQADLALTN
jgi:hypothetical protein